MCPDNENSPQEEEWMPEAWGEVSVPFVSTMPQLSSEVGLQHAQYARFFPLGGGAGALKKDLELIEIASAIIRAIKKEPRHDWVESVPVGFIDEKNGEPLRLAIVIRGDGSGSESSRKNRQIELVTEIRDAVDIACNNLEINEEDRTKLQDGIVLGLNKRRKIDDHAEVSLIQPMTESEVTKAEVGEPCEVDRKLPPKETLVKKSWFYPGLVNIDSVDDALRKVVVSFSTIDGPKKAVGPILASVRFNRDRLHLLVAQLFKLQVRVDMTVTPKGSGATARIKTIYTDEFQDLVTSVTNDAQVRSLIEKRKAINNGESASQSQVIPEDMEVIG
jgi:hypothetical protein